MKDLTLGEDQVKIEMTGYHGIINNGISDENRIKLRLKSTGYHGIINNVIMSDGNRLIQLKVHLLQTACEKIWPLDFYAYRNSLSQQSVTNCSKLAHLQLY